MGDDVICDYEPDDNDAQRDADLDEWEDLDTWLALLCGEHGSA